MSDYNGNWFSIPVALCGFPIGRGCNSSILRVIRRYMSVHIGLAKRYGYRNTMFHNVGESHSSF